MTRQRVLEIVLAIVAIVSIPPSLVRWWLDRTPKTYQPEPSPDQKRYDAAFGEALRLEQSRNYPQAISKFVEAQMFANRLEENQRRSLIRLCDEHLTNCYTENGQNDLAWGSFRRVTLGMIEEGEFLLRNRRFDEARSQFEEAESRILQMPTPNETDLEVARRGLLAVYCSLQRYADADAVSDRMIESIHQPLGDNRSALGEKYLEIAKLRSEYKDWEGAEKACSRAIDEFERTQKSYPKSETASARTSMVIAMYWLQITYVRQQKWDLAQSAAENAFQANQEVWGAYGLARGIATLALDVATQSNDPKLVELWRQRLSALPQEPCPVPNVNNPACITHSASDAFSIPNAVPH